METIHIDLSKGQNVYFTSDLHLGHRNVLKFCKRPFANVDKMNDVLVDNWNEVVADNDYIFNLGDFFWYRNSIWLRSIILKLQGHKFFLPGNHDDLSVYENTKDIDSLNLLSDVVRLFITAEDWKEREWPKNILEIYLCHYPMMTWPHRGNNSIQLFGHIHSQEGREGYDQDLPLFKNQYDVGVDNNNYKPISLEEVLKKINWGYST